MAKSDVGYIYILTNESFHKNNWVKIGYTSDIPARITQLSNTSVPLPFELYACYEIPASEEMDKSDKFLFALIEQLDPDLRISNKREFFEIEPEDAYNILYAIAKIHGREDKLVDGEGRKEYLASQQNGGGYGGKKKPTQLPKMDWCIEQGLIKPGDKVYLAGFDDFVVEVVDSKKVLYQGKIMSYNAFGCAVTGWKAIQIYVYLTIVGEDETLDFKRKAKLKELENQ